jgi:hypothetical protein
MARIAERAQRAVHRFFMEAFARRAVSPITPFQRTMTGLFLAMLLVVIALIVVASSLTCEEWASVGARKCLRYTWR